MSSTTAQLETQIRQNLNQPVAPSSGLWSSTQIQQKIANRLRRLNRFFKTGSIDTSITTTSAVEYNFPTGVVSIDKIELWDTSVSPNTNKGELTNWKVFNDAGTLKIIFPSALLYSTGTPTTNTLKLYSHKRLNEVTPDLQLEEEELVTLGSTMDCLRDLLRSQIDMTKYLASAVKGQGNTADVLNAIREYRNEYNEAFNYLRKSKVQKLGFGQ